MANDEKSTMVKMAMIYSQNEEWYKAIEEYKKLLTLEPENAHIFNVMGDAFFKKGDDQDAMDCYLKSKHLYTDQSQQAKVASLNAKIAKLSESKLDVLHRRQYNGICKIALADKLAREDKLSEAVEVYQQLIAAEPINYTYREQLAHFYLDHAQVYEALDQWKFLANEFLAQQQFEQAQYYAQKMKEIDSESLEVLEIMTGIQLQSGGSVPASSWIQMAKKAFEVKQFEKSKQALDRLASPLELDIRLLQIQVLMALKLYSEARKSLMQFETLQEHPELILFLIEIDEALKEWAAMVEHIKEFLKHHPDDIKMRVKEARAQIQLGRSDLALAIYSQLVQEALAKNQVDSALSYLESILAFQPDHIETLKKKAELCLKQNKHPQMLATYKEMIQILKNKNMHDDARKIQMVVDRLSRLVK
jgi:tetratricopeptide (TPR) repeat protein